jgi:hypothetical protein
MSGGIIDPTGGRGRSDIAPTGTDAARPRRLDGLRVGLCENGKRNAAAVLDAVGRELADTHHVGATVPVTKVQFAMPMPEELVERLLRDCDAVVIGVGDCGSCSASAVADGIRLEQAGLPTAVICTDAFETTSRAMAELQGDADHPFLLTEHPIANLTPEQIARRAGPPPTAGGLGRCACCGPVWGDAGWDASVPDVGGSRTLSPSALEALVSGIALYPNPLVDQILDASTHPAALRQAALARYFEPTTNRLGSSRFNSNCCGSPRDAGANGLSVPSKCLTDSGNDLKSADLKSSDFWKTPTEGWISTARDGIDGSRFARNRPDISSQDNAPLVNGHEKLFPERTIWSNP